MMNNPLTPVYERTKCFCKSIDPAVDIRRNERTIVLICVLIANPASAEGDRQRAFLSKEGQANREATRELTEAKIEMPLPLRNWALRAGRIYRPVSKNLRLRLKIRGSPTH